MKKYKFHWVALLFALVQCQAQKTALTLTGATQQGWSGGAAGSGSGINYKVTFKALKGGTYKFAYLYNGDVVLPVQHTTTPGKVDSIVNLKAGEAVTLMANRYFPGEVDMRVHRDSMVARINKVNAEKAGPLPKFEGKGLLIYYFDGKKQYAPVSSFKALPDIAYP